MSTTTPSPTMLRATADDQRIFALAASRDHAFTPAEQELYLELKQRHLGEFNGGLQGGAYGTASGGFQWLVKFVQEFARLLNSGTDLNAAFTQASGEAGTYASHAGMMDGLSALHTAMTQAGGNLAASANAVTGIASTRTPIDRNEISHPDNLLAQITTARGQQNYTPSNRGSMNLTPTYQPDAPRFTDTLPSTEIAYQPETPGTAPERPAVPDQRTGATIAQG